MSEIGNIKIARKLGDRPSVPEVRRGSAELVCSRRSAEADLAFEAAGRVIGMTVFGPRRRVLVIPSATIARVAASLEGHGRIPRGDLGLGLRLVAVEDGRFGRHGDGLVNHFASERD